MAAQDIFLIRHAESTWNAAGRWQGQADPPLTERGHAQALRLANDLEGLGITHLITSDLQRALDTCTPVGHALGIEPVIDPRLRELDVGTWSGRTREEIRREEPGALELYFSGQAGWTGGESYDEHEQRAQAVATELHDLPDGTVVALVTHGGTLRALALALLGLAPDQRRRFSGMWHTAIAHLERGSQGYFLTAYNADAATLRRRYADQRTV